MVKKWTIYRKINVLAVIASLISLFLPLYTNKGAVSSFISIFTFLSDHIPKLYKFSTSNPGAFEFLSISAIALIFFSVCSVLNLFCTLVIKRYHIRKPVCIALSICTSISSIIIIIFSLMADSTQYSLYYTVPVMLFFSITTFICSVLEPSAFIPANEYPSKKIYDNHQNTLIDSDFSITCLSGEYSGGKFPIDNGNKLNIGRDPAKCQVVINSPKISRLHCSITSLPDENMYLITDFSSNGTFTLNGTRIDTRRPVMFPHGTIIVMGNKKISFKLD